MSENGFEVIGISSAGEALEEVTRQENVRTIAVEMTRTISPFKDIRSVWKLYRIFKREKPLIVHTHTPKAGTVGMFAAWLAGVPHRLHTVAGLPLLLATGKKRKLLDFVEKMTYRWATIVYPNSYGLYDIILQNKYTTKSKLKVIGKGSSNGIDTTHFNPDLIPEEQKQQLRNSLGIKHNDFVYVFVGRMVKDKGINELVAAFGQVHKKYANTKLILVGGFERHLDPLKPETEKEIDTNSCIVAAGHQKDVRPYFAIADVFTFPSYREGFPNVLMQSCAMGVASIATDINGCNEIVEDGYNGIIIPSQNQDKLLEKMFYLYENAEVRKQIAEVSRDLIIKNYERSYVQNEILNEYHSLIKEDNV
ncbi:MAG: glycosyltransferase family 4 protein [Chitinophagaceae bacterium]|nr:glycosyltransferase family 4 protein [Chitinophagaceae bacterium]MCW5928609.1 glycosyltransferase family 4 protein [Chitinophagaceae bacterium]